VGPLHSFRPRSRFQCRPDHSRPGNSTSVSTTCSCSSSLSLTVPHTARRPT
ncbi:hypothetical protein BaRGS_00017261, partial [Batillaria attramentaria]